MATPAGTCHSVSTKLSGSSAPQLRPYKRNPSDPESRRSLSDLQTPASGLSRTYRLLRMSAGIYESGHSALRPKIGLARHPAMRQKADASLGH